MGTFDPRDRCPYCGKEYWAECRCLTKEDESSVEETDLVYNSVSKPSHYNIGDGIEAIAYIKQVLGLEGFVAYCRGNVMKYNHRAMYKGNPTEDMAKAQQYLEWANETMKEIYK